MPHTYAVSRRGVWSIVAAASLWGTTGVTTALLYQLSATNALSIAFLRLGIAALLLLLLCWRSLRGQMWRVKGRDALLMLCMGIMQAISQYSYLAAITACGVTIATLIAICLSPVVVVLFATLYLHERMTRKIALALLCALVGMALLTGAPAANERFHNPLPGIGLACITAISYAIAILISRTLSTRYDTLQINAAVFGSSTIVLLACALYTPLVFSYPLTSWLLLIYMGSIPSALGYALFQYGVRSTPATLASILTFCEPLTAALLAWAIFGESLSLAGIAGSILLLGTIALLAFAEGKSDDRAEVA